MNIEKIKEMSININILFVEDNIETRESFSRYLKEIFKSVTTCSNGEEALVQYHQDPFDIIITDIEMPLLNGLELSKKIKRINNDQKIIILSAYSEVEHFLDFIRIGIDGYILKPINYEQLNLTLYKVIEQVNLQKLQDSYHESLEDSVKEKIKELQELYVRDSLTQLPNFCLLQTKILPEQKQTIILLDINHFELINNNFGRDLGDTILIKIANKLKKHQTDTFRLYRLGGDEFAFLANGNLANQAQSIVHAIKKDFEKNSIKFHSLEINIFFSIVIEYGKKHNILKNASLSLSRLRKQGKNNISIHEDDKEYKEQQKNNLLWIKKLKNALLKDQLVPFFHPIVNIHNPNDEKYEVLARIVLENKDVILPQFFIKAAYFTGLGTKITRLMIDKSLKQIENTTKSLSFNITQEDLEENYLKDYLESRVKQYSISKEQITLEILETISDHSAQNALTQLKNLKLEGYKISIDDFGAESSNFSRLLNFDVDYIKIDGSFIKNIDENSKQKAIVESLISFSKKIGAEVVAEFVHSEKIFTILKDLGIDYVQGYFIAEPFQKFEQIKNVHKC